MEKDQKNIDDLFREELGGYTDSPPPEVWDALEKRLNGKRGFPWYWSALIGFGVLLSVAVISKVPSALFTTHAQETQTAKIAPKPGTTLAIARNGSTGMNPLNDPSGIVSKNKNKNAVDTPIKGHSQATANTGNKTGNANKLTLITNAPITKQTAYDNDNTTANNNNITPDGNSGNVNPAPAANHITFEKYQPIQDVVVKTNKHHILVTYTEPSPVSKNNNTDSQSSEQELAIENTQPVTAPVYQKEIDVKSNNSGVLHSSSLPVKRIVSTINIASVSANSNIITKDSKTSKNNSAPIVQATIKAEHDKEQSAHKRAIIAAITAKKKANSHTPKIIAAISTHPKKHTIIQYNANTNTEKSISKKVAKISKLHAEKKQHITQNKPIAFAANNIVKKINAPAEKQKTSNSTLASKSILKHHNGNPAAKALVVNKKVGNKTPIHTNKQPSKMATPPAANIYSSGNTNTISGETLPAINKTIASKKEEQKPIITFKTDAGALPGTQSASNTLPDNNTYNTDSNAAGKINFGRFEAGLKAGYEGGFSNDASKKFVVSPYLQYNISPRFSIMTQPSINASHVSVKLLSGTNSFYQVNNDGKYTLDSTEVVVITPPDSSSFWKRNYTYTQSHDSIVKSYTSGGAYVELELPILAKYSISKRLSVYGGPVLDYSKLVGITEKTYNSGPIIKTGSASTLAPVNASAPAVAPLDSVITYTGTPITNYTGPLYSSEQNGLFRFGYMFGFTYEFRKRWLLDALVHQSFVKPDIQGGYDVNKPYSAPYFRITLGYKLIK